MTISLGDILHLVALLMATGGLIWRMSALASDVRALQKAIEKADPHVGSIPLIGQRLAALEIEFGNTRQRQHELANNLQWIIGQLEALQPREPSRPDLSVERDPRRR